MSNDHIKSEISLYLAQGLTESRNRQIEAHTASCDKCRTALNKARAKQARLKREALKKASPDRLPNLFLARQGKDVGVDHMPAKSPWLVLGFFLLASGGYWTFKHYSGVSRSAPVSVLEPDSHSVDASSATASGAGASPAAAGVVGAESPAQVEPPKPPVVIPVQQEWKGTESSIKESRSVVIRNKEAWEALWTEMQVYEPRPEINFTQYTVIGIFAGERPLGTTLAFGKIREREEEIYAPYRITHPQVQVSTMTALPTSLSHPYLFALLPRVDKKIRLTQKEVSQ